MSAAAAPEASSADQGGRGEEEEAAAASTARQEPDTQCPRGTRVLESDRSREPWASEPCILGIGACAGQRRRACSA